MSYSTSTKAADKVESFLQTLVNLRGDSISWIAADPSKLAYQIRQGMSVAENNPDKYSEFAKLKKTFKISTGPNLVIASRYVSLVETLEPEELTSKNFAKSVNIFEVTEVADVMEVIGAILANPNYEEYQFKDYTEITEKELETLYKWTHKNEIFIINSKCLIISRKEPPEDLAWTPIKDD